MAHIEDFKEGDRVIYNREDVRDSGVVCLGDDGDIGFVGRGGPRIWVRWDSNGLTLHTDPRFLRNESKIKDSESHITVESAIKFLVDSGFEVTVRKVN